MPGRPAPRSLEPGRRTLKPETRNPKPGCQTGFSLVEILIALFITAILAGLGTSMVLGTVASRGRFDAVLGGARALELAHAALAADLGQLVVRQTRGPDGETREWIFAGGDATYGGPLLALARAGRDNPGGLEARGSIVYVEYRLDDGRLIRRAWTRVDPTERTPLVERVLLDGVKNARVRFGDGEAWAPGFLSKPGGKRGKALPPLVELDLDVDGTGRVRQVFATGLGE